MTVDLHYLDRIIDDLSAHTAGYPPAFDSPDELDRARSNVKALSDMLNTFGTGPSANAQLLLRIGVSNSIGHNLDIPGTAARAVAAFTTLLQQSPDDARTNYYYGRFLVYGKRPLTAP